MYSLVRLKSVVFFQYTLGGSNSIAHANYQNICGSLVLFFHLFMNLIDLYSQEGWMQNFWLS
jgi:hypothetical protein